jgi:hypothetical protein
MSEEVMAFRLPLSPISDVMNAQDPKWTCHAYKDAEPNQESFKSLRTVKGLVNQTPMHSNGMTE